MKPSWLELKNKKYAGLSYVVVYDCPMIPYWPTYLRLSGYEKNPHTVIGYVLAAPSWYRIPP